jgi:hypothetical protein
VVFVAGGAAVEVGAHAGNRGVGIGAGELQLYVAIELGEALSSQLSSGPKTLRDRRLRECAGRRQPDRLELHHLGERVVIMVVMDDRCAKLLCGGRDQVVDDRYSLCPG